MEGFEPQPQPQLQTLPVEAKPQGGDNAAAVEELLKSGGVPPAHVEPLRREASGLTRLGNSPLARKIYFCAAGLSLMAAKGVFASQGVESQMRQPAVAVGAEARDQGDPLRRLEEQIRALREAEVGRKEKERAIEVLEKETKEFAFDTGVRLQKIKMFGIGAGDIDVGYFNKQREALANKLKLLQEAEAALGLRGEGYISHYATGVLADVEKLLAYTQNNVEKLQKAKELRNILEKVEARWKQGDFPSANEKRLVDEARGVLKAIQEELSQNIK